MSISAQASTASTRPRAIISASRPKKLEIQEAALLAALPKAPSKLNLRDNLAGARDRQLYVLAEMVDQGFITKEQSDTARAAEVKIIDAPVYDAQLGYVLDTSAERVKAMLPRLPGDLVVTISIDPDLQEEIESVLVERIAKDGKAQGASQVGALVMAKDGRVVAMVGGADYSASEFNRVTQAKRQPGSSFKPFVYAAALEDGFSPYDVMIDAPLTIEKWKPENYGGGYLGADDAQRSPDPLDQHDCGPAGAGSERGTHHLAGPSGSA